MAMDMLGLIRGVRGTMIGARASSTTSAASAEAASTIGSSGTTTVIQRLVATPLSTLMKEIFATPTPAARTMESVLLGAWRMHCG